MRKIIIISLILLCNVILLFSEDFSSIQQIKEKRIKWREEKFIDNLLKEAKLTEADDFIFLEEYYTDYSQGLIILNKHEYFYYENGKIIKKTLSKQQIKELSKIELNNDIKTNHPARGECYYSVFVKKDNDVKYSIYNQTNLVKSNIDNNAILKIFEILGLEVYSDW